MGKGGERVESVGQKVDKGLVWRLILGGTSERVLSRLANIPISQIREIMEEER